MFALDIAEGIATLTLSRAPVNAISEEWLHRFDEKLDELEQRDDWKVLLLRSDQKVFCAGADLRQIRDLMEVAEGPDRRRGVGRTVWRPAEHGGAQAPSDRRLTRCSLCGAGGGDRHCRQAGQSSTR